jgi:hypothetical protein
MQNDLIRRKRTEYVERYLEALLRRAQSLNLLVNSQYRSHLEPNNKRGHGMKAFKLQF